MKDPKHSYKIDRQDKLPLYSQIEQNFREMISGGLLKSGDPIPSEWELADLYTVSRLTVRHALDNLARQGWLNRRHGVGTFVANPGVARLAPSKLSFTEQMRATGRQPGSRQIHVRVNPAAAEVAYYLRIQEEEPVVEIMRVRLADGEPVMLETSYLSQKRFPGLDERLDLSNASLYEYLGVHYQTFVATMNQTLEPVLLSKSDAAYLNAEAGTPAMYSEVVAYTADDLPIEYSWSVTRGDRCKFVFSFRRDENSADLPSDGEPG
jgi:GntR family transcriptional regulator